MKSGGPKREIVEKNDESKVYQDLPCDRWHGVDG
jgi:hypothetical protein